MTNIKNKALNFIPVDIKLLPILSSMLEENDTESMAIFIRSLVNTANELLNTSDRLDHLGIKLSDGE